MSKLSLACFVTDQVGRTGTRIPASVLMKAEETHLGYVAKQNLPRGYPVNLQHDMTRLAGWSSILGHLIDSNMVQVIGVIEVPENSDEWIKLKSIAELYWMDHHLSGNEEFKLELSQKVYPELLCEANTHYYRVESFMAVSENLAARLYPDLFSRSSEYVDKDGLTDYRYLLERLKVIQPGVFLDKDRQILLFAHRFFRRSLSHRNKLNDHFLASFVSSAGASQITSRLRLDPDLVGHPSTLKEVVELEYWYGPKFSDDIESIPAGVTTHKASGYGKVQQGIDKTDFWWKQAEGRRNFEQTESFRTLEVEELTDLPSLGVSDEYFGCRYAHAEYSIDSKVISHFDGAIRGYFTESYLNRIDQNIDRAGKHSDYTKLFRFDGELSVSCWKRLLNDYFKGNILIPEYFENNDNICTSYDSGKSELKLVAEEEPHNDAIDTDPLCAFIQIKQGHLVEKLDVVGKYMSIRDGLYSVKVIETGSAAVYKLLCAHISLESFASLYCQDKRLQVVPLQFGPSSDFPNYMYQFVEKFAEALAQDVSDLGLSSIAVSITWSLEEHLISLSLRGPSISLIELLRKLFTVVDPTKPASHWIEGLAEMVSAMTDSRICSPKLYGVSDGVLGFDRKGQNIEITFPPELAHILTEDGPA